MYQTINLFFPLIIHSPLAYGFFMFQIYRNLSRHLFTLQAAILVLLTISAGSSQAADSLAYRLTYTVELQPEQERAFVTLEVDKSELLRRIEFDTKPEVHANIKATGDITLKDGRAIWVLPAEKAKLSYYVNITHMRDPGKFDALINKDWAIFRGDDIIPAMFSDFEDGAYSQVTLTFKLPKNWSIETGWPRKKGNTFRIDNPDRRFDRPTGWMIAGKLGTRRTKIGNTSIAVSAPKGSSLRRMDALTFLSFVWPQVQNAFGETPDKLLIVGEGDPMWRGGLSASNSLFLHSDRPMVSENGTSPIIHELVHMMTRISGVKSETATDDWIAEGIAEFYSIELLYRAKGLTSERRSQIMKRLEKWSKDVKNLRAGRSHGAITARAVVLLDDLDKEIRIRSKYKYTLDDVTRKLIAKRKVSLDDLRQATEELIGSGVKSLQTPLLPQ